MTVIDFLENVFKKDKKSESVSAATYCYQLEEELKYYRMALQIVAERISSVISNVEWETMVKDEVKQGESWYLFNFEPNPHQSGVEFKKQIASKLVLDRECLVVEVNGKYYVAEDFDIQYPSDSSLGDALTFTNVTINLYGDNLVTLNKAFRDDEAIYMRYQNPMVESIYQTIGSVFAELIENAKKIGNSNVKYTLNIDTVALSGLNVDIPAEIKRIVNEDFRALASGDNVIMPLYNGFELNPLNQGNNNAEMTSIANKSVNEEIEKVLIYVARGYNIPSDIALGEEKDGSYITFMTFCIDPIVAIIENAFNRVYFGKMLIFKGKRLKINTRNTKHFEILSAGSTFSQLISSGVMTINNILELLDMPKAEPEIGDKHWITRNYAIVGDFIQEAAAVRQEEQNTETKETSAIGGGLK